MVEPRVTAPILKEMKSRGEKITALTAYDYPTARLLDEAGIDIAMVGDSVGMVVLGFDSTLPVTMDIMIHHTAAVARAVKRALVVADMPFMSWHASTDNAVRNAGRFLQEAGAQAVKIEGGAPVAETVRHITDLGIPVMGHLGMTPQSVHQFGGYRMQGREEAAALRIEEDAKMLQDAGIFALVLELVPADLARRITQDLSIPTIGIGAGPDCDGQVQVVHDILGLYDKFVPKHAKQYAKLWDAIREALSSYAAEVRSGTFPERTS
jgi:3-methyl-2-oxobutanoate hydroxymethyltransferase